MLKTLGLLIGSLAVAGAQPMVTNLQPPATTAGAPAVILQVSGRGFTPSTRILFDGTALPARFESGSRIVVELPATRLLKAGAVSITAQEDKITSDPFVFTINPPIEWITQADLPVATERQFYSQAFAVSGGTPPVRFSLASGTVPAGLHLDGYNGSIVGYATATGEAELVVRASDASGAAANQTLRLKVAGELRITSPPTLPVATLGKAYASSVDASGGVAPKMDFALTAGALPKGIALEAATGRLAGTPQTAGSFPFSVRVRDAFGRTASAALSILVVSPLTATVPAELSAYVEGDSVETRLAAQGGVPPYEWTVMEGRLPPGLDLTPGEGLVRGIPEAAGIFPVVLRVRDRSGASVTTRADFRVNGQLRVSKVSDPEGVVGVDFTFPLAAQGGVPPYRWSTSAKGEPIPEWLRIEGTRLVGRPTGEGLFTVALDVADSGGRKADGRWLIQVRLAPLPVAVVALPDTLATSRQQEVGLRIDRAYPTDLEVEFSVRFEAAAPDGPDDPAVLLSTGGRTARVRLPAGRTVVSPALQLQTGTTAGKIAWKARIAVPGRTNAESGEAQVEGRSVIPPAPPQVRSVKAKRTPEGFEVVTVALSPTRQLDSAVFAFDDVAQVTVPLDKTAGAWYGSEGSQPYGTAFVYQQVFTVRGDSSRVRGVSLVLRNGAGTSVPVSAAF